MSWDPPRKYKGRRSQWRQAAAVNMPKHEPTGGRSLNMVAERAERFARQNEMEEWCETYCSQEWHFDGYRGWSFAKTTEAVLFKMIFGGK